MSKLSFVEHGDERAEKTGACQEKVSPSSQLCAGGADQKNEGYHQLPA